MNLFSLNFVTYSFDLCPNNSFSLSQLSRILENSSSALEMSSVISVGSLNFALSITLFTLAAISESVPAEELLSGPS